MRVALWVLAGALFAAGCVAAPPSPAPAETRIAPTGTPPLPSPAPTVSPTASCVERGGTWETTAYPGVAVRQEIPVRVYLPGCHGVSGDRYPVAYFLHGKPYTEGQWVDLGIEALVARGAASGDLPPMILVLARQPEPLFSNSDGGPGSYETEFFDGLVSWVDRSYATDPRPEKRAVVGISRGGVWALELGMTHPEFVGSVAALSPALAVNYPRRPYDPNHLAGDAPALPGSFWLAAGETDWARAQTEALARVLTDRGSPAELVIIPGAHADSTWETLLPAVLGFLASRLG